VTLAIVELPPVRGFWSLTLYNAHHFLAPNDLVRYSLGTKNKSLEYGSDGSLTIYVQPDSPGADKESNLAARAEGRFLALRPRVLVGAADRERPVDTARGREGPMSRSAGA
jgi:hypothetical protein